MDDILPTTPADATRLDADPAPAETDADPAAAALAAFSPEAVEILKTLPEADMALLQRMAVQMQGEAAEQAIVAAGEGAALEAGEEAEEAEDATMPQASQALTMDMVHAAIADAIAKMGAKKDTTPPAPAMDAGAKPKTTAAPPAKTEARADAAEVARRAADLVQADQRFVEHVRSAGYRCDSVKSAGEAALAAIAATSPKSVQDAASRALKDGRRDDLLALFDAADEQRRGGYVRDQLAVLDSVHGGALTGRGGTGPGNVVPSHTTFPDRAIG